MTHKQLFIIAGLFAAMWMFPPFGVAVTILMGGWLLWWLVKNIVKVPFGLARMTLGLPFAKPKETILISGSGEDEMNYVEFTPDTIVKTKRGNVAWCDIEIGDIVRLEDGWHPILMKPNPYQR